MRKFDLSLRSSRSSYFATFRHQLTILSKTDALDEEKWLNMLGTFVKDWFRYESHFVHGRENVDGMNIISNDGSNKLNRSRKARVSYKVQRTINASLNAATSTRAVSSNPNFVTRQKIEIIFG